MAVDWVGVPGWPGFSVTDRGLIRGPSGNVLRPMVNDTGHLYVTRGRDSRKLYVHRAVLLSFVGEPKPGQEARHWNGIPSDNRRCNLRWGTRKQQRADDRRNGVRSKRNRKLDMVEADHIRCSQLSSRRLGRLYGVSHTTVQKIRNGDRYVR